MTPDKKKSLARRRPAETGTAVAGAIVLIVTWALSLKGIKVPNNVAVAATVVVAAIPAGITWIVEKRREFIAGE